MKAKEKEKMYGNLKCNFEKKSNYTPNLTIEKSNLNYLNPF